MIPYGGHRPDRTPGEEAVRALGLQPDGYLVAIGRIEPENNILMIVEAFSRRDRGAKLLVLGAFDDTKPYHRRILEAASKDVIFPGAIYDRETVTALRFHARAYLHGHSVGGTNPSLVEALWAGNAVLAHDNPYNRWTADEAGMFFRTIDDCDAGIERILLDDAFVMRARVAATRRAAQLFNQDEILTMYEEEALGMIGSEPETTVHAGQRVNHPAR
jgi:glycosyltransferase involved in cell wall biosynthesis